MNAALTVPQAAFAAAVLDPSQPSPAGLTCWNDSDPSKRFAVYRNNVISSLITALTDTFPVLAQLVGDDFFRAMAHCFVQAHPPSTPILTRYGEQFAAFAGDFPPAASLPYLPDVARLEYARVVAYHAPDAEALNRAQIGAALADPERAGTASFTLHPSLQCLRGNFAAVSLWAAHQGVLSIESVDPSHTEHALVWRQGLDVELMQIDTASLIFIEQLQQSQPLGHAAAEAIAQDAGFDLAARLAHLIGAGLITGVHWPYNAEGSLT